MAFAELATPDGRMEDRTRVGETERRYRRPAWFVRGQTPAVGRPDSRHGRISRSAMKAAVIDHYGSNDVVRIAEVAVPTTGPTDLLVRVRAASVNPLDVKTRRGEVKVLLKYRFPLVLGNDLAGEVVDLGAQVTRFRKGDVVYARLDAERIGAFAEYAVVREGAAALKPTNVTCEEAASLPLVALTAWQALVEIGKLRAGQRALIHAGSGGVGTVAIQLARHLGATVFTTVGRRNVDLVKRLGADVAIDYRSERFEDVARDCDVVLDSAGGDTLVRSFECVRPGGVVVSIGGTPSAAFARRRGLNPLLVLALGIMSRKATTAASRHGARYEYLFMRADGDQLREITRLVEAGAITPLVDRTFPLAQVREALMYSEAGRATGKVVVEVA
jgi:NADPH:quinone reductase-like Zn-dependent oxidoreductase